MNTIFDQLWLLRRRGPDDEWDGPPVRYWRRVPRINMLPRSGQAGGTRGAFRVVPAAVILAEVIFLALQLQARSSDEAATETAKKQLPQVQANIASAQSDLEAVQTQLDEAKKGVEAAMNAYAQATGGRTNWYPGAVALLNMQTEGVRFDAIAAKPGGEIALDGVAADLAALTRFQSKLKEASQFLRLQNISFDTTGSSLKFAATLKVVQ